MFTNIDVIFTHAQCTGWQRTTATSFHRQNTCNVCANTLEYWSKYTNILNPTVRKDRPSMLTGLANCQICVRFKKAAGRT